MSRAKGKPKADRKLSANLTILPLDLEAVRRLALTLSPHELKETRLTTLTALITELEPLLIEIDRMEALASAIDSPHSPDLVRLIVGLRRDAERLYGCLADSFKWV